MLQIWRMRDEPVFMSRELSHIVIETGGVGLRHQRGGDVVVRSALMPEFVWRTGPVPCALFVLFCFVFVYAAPIVVVVWLVVVVVVVGLPVPFYFFFIWHACSFCYFAFSEEKAGVFKPA